MQKYEKIYFPVKHFRNPYQLSEPSNGWKGKKKSHATVSLERQFTPCTVNRIGRSNLDPDICASVCLADKSSA
jgi:hypothetical protein